MTIDSKSSIAEQSIHEKMRALAEQISEEHGIAIQSVRFRWLDCSTPQQPKSVLTTIEMETESSH